MKERIIIVFIAAALGLILTTAGFFLYQSMNALPDDAKPDSPLTLDKKETPQKKSDFYITIDDPKHESLSTKRSIEVRGTTNPTNTIVISSNQEEIVAKPTPDGKFSTTITIDAGTNILTSRAIAPNGESVQDVRVVSFTAEDF